MARLYLLLGGNRDDRLAYLNRAAALVSKHIGIIENKSSIYETRPWGFSDTTNFYNRALIVRSILEPKKVLETINSIEKELGRERRDEKYSSRTIDIDIIFYNDLIIDEEDLIIPHPRMEKRRFVLVPFNEIAPGKLHPVHKKSVSELLAECKDNLPVRPL